MDNIKNILDSVVNLMEQDSRGVQLGCYSVALVGLAVAIRRVRPFSRFRKPSDIPNHFVNERKELAGVVERIDPNGGLLMICHKPLITVPGLPDGQLPVKIFGVNVSGLGLNWLQTIVAGSQVKFIPVVKARDFVECEVLLPQIQNDKSVDINVGESLVKIGFGEVAGVNKPARSDRRILKYLNRLEVAHNYAVRKKMGLKYYIKPTISTLGAIGKGIGKLTYYLYRRIIHIPRMSTS